MFLGEFFERVPFGAIHFHVKAFVFILGLCVHVVNPSTDIYVNKALFGLH